MPKFFVEEFENNPAIKGEDAYHICKSLRMRAGERLTVCDLSGSDYFCNISEVSKDEIKLNILEKTETVGEPSVHVTLFQCLLKGDKFEDVIKHSVELGVNAIVPVVSQHCVSRTVSVSKLERWNKISKEAAGQSGRGIIPKVENVIGFSKIANDFDALILCYEHGGRPIKELISTQKNIGIIVGSEGGFSKEEAAVFPNVTLGKRILRAETAPLCALSAIMLLSENME